MRDPEQFVGFCCLQRLITRGLDASRPGLLEAEGVIATDELRFFDPLHLDWLSDMPHSNMWPRLL